MHWVIQNNLYHEMGHTKLIETLERFNIPFSLIDITENHTIEPDVNPEGFVMTCGAITMSKVSKQKNWIPGTFLNDNFHFSKWKENYKENLLNFDSVIGKLGEIEHKWDNFFIRPCEDTKTFTGRTFEWNEFVEWRIKKSPNIISSMSSIKNIFREYRFFVVDNELVTWSQYKLGNTVTWHLSDIDPYIIEFAQEMVNIWQPARAFVIDIALTDIGLKIIELNNINSAGFYAIDIQKLVFALDSMQFDK